MTPPVHALRRQRVAAFTPSLPPRPTVSTSPSSSPLPSNPSSRQPCTLVAAKPLPAPSTRCVVSPRRSVPSSSPRSTKKIADDTLTSTTTSTTTTTRTTATKSTTTTSTTIASTTAPSLDVISAPSAIRYLTPVPEALPHEIYPTRRGRNAQQRTRYAEHFRRYMYLRRLLKPWSDSFRARNGRTPSLVDVHDAQVPGLFDRFVEYLDALDGLRVDS